MLLPISTSVGFCQITNPNFIRSRLPLKFAGDIGGRSNGRKEISLVRRGAGVRANPSDEHGAKIDANAGVNGRNLSTHQLWVHNVFQNAEGRHGDIDRQIRRYCIAFANADQSHDTVARVFFNAAAVVIDNLHASQSLKDVYAAAKTYLADKLGLGSSATQALDLALEKPESEARQTLLYKESAATGLEMDAGLSRLGEGLATLLPAGAGQVRQTVRVASRVTVWRWQRGWDHQPVVADLLPSDSEQYSWR